MKTVTIITTIALLATVMQPAVRAQACSVAEHIERMVASAALFGSGVLLHNATYNGSVSQKVANGLCVVGACFAIQTVLNASESLITTAHCSVKKLASAAALGCACVLALHMNNDLRGNSELHRLAPGLGRVIDTVTGK